MSETATGDGRQSAGERLAGDMTEVVREEARAVREDLADAARPAAAGLVLIGAAAGCVVLGVGAASTTALRMLETVLPGRLASAGLTAGYLAGAAVLGGMGLQRLQAAGGSSQRLAEQIRETVTQTLSRPGHAGVSAVRETLGERSDA
ncbi:phage holin family protein [Actinoplanes sp. NPDC026619]|uniref:phage holin family protein n=1 Tax=Actinoplanes sp. NPDC026619 TaxID=3155798 RepID=UPI0033F6A365